MMNGSGGSGGGYSGGGGGMRMHPGDRIGNAGDPDGYSLNSVSINGLHNSLFFLYIDSYTNLKTVHLTYFHVVASLHFAKNLIILNRNVSMYLTANHSFSGKLYVAIFRLKSLSYPIDRSKRVLLLSFLFIY